MKNGLFSEHFVLKTCSSLKCNPKQKFQELYGIKTNLFVLTLEKLKRIFAVGGEDLYLNMT